MYSVKFFKGLWHVTHRATGVVRSSVKLGVALSVIHDQLN